MTVAAVTPRAVYLDTGVPAALPTVDTAGANAPWRFLAAADLIVQRVAVDGTVTQLVLGTDYTVAGAGGPGAGSVTPLAGVAGTTIVIERNTPAMQPSAWTSNGGFQAATLEGALDRQAMAEQDARLRAVSAAPGEVGFVMPRLVDRLSKVLGFDSSGNTIAVPSALPEVQEEADDAAASAAASANSANEADASENTAILQAAIASAQAAAAAGSAALAALYLAAALAAAAGNFFATTADALSKGVVNTASLVGGATGTNGTFPLAFSGGAGSGAAGVFVVAAGVVTQITITSKGVGYTSAPAISFAASAGLAGASATAVIGNRTNAGDYFLVAGSGNIYAELYRNVAGLATDQNLALIASSPALLGVLDTVFAATDDVTPAGHALSLQDADGRILLALGADGVPVDSPAFASAVASAAGVDNTRASLDKAARHGLTFTYTDYWGVTIGGQSNAVGTNEVAITTAQPFNNKRRSGAALIPLVEAGTETVTSGATAHAKDKLLRVLPPWSTFPQDWVANNMGSSGTPLSGICHGTAPYNAGLAAVTAIKAAAIAAGKSYAERGLFLIHGETDAHNNVSQADYYNSGASGANLIDYKNNWNTDVLAITGQTDRIPLFIEQVAIGDTYTAGHAGPALAMLQAAENDSEVFIIAPGYAFRFGDDGLHFNAHNQRHLGEYYGKALHRYYIDRRNPGTVRPLTWTRADARTIDVTFYVPVPPLVFDLDRVWPGDLGMGFAIYDSTGPEIAIANVRLTGPASVRITTAADVTAGDFVTYATKLYTRTHTGGLDAGNRRGARGNLRDSDMTASYYTDAFGATYPLQNWCAIFNKTLA